MVRFQGCHPGNYSVFPESEEAPDSVGVQRRFDKCRNSPWEFIPCDLSSKKLKILDMKPLRGQSTRSESGISTRSSCRSVSGRLLGEMISALIDRFVGYFVMLVKCEFFLVFDSCANIWVVEVRQSPFCVATNKKYMPSQESFRYLGRHLLWQ